MTELFGDKKELVKRELKVLAAPALFWKNTIAYSHRGFRKPCLLPEFLALEAIMVVVKEDRPRGSHGRIGGWTVVDFFIWAFLNTEAAVSGL